nr:DUF724 domain-containing protein 3 [Ipomoea trifida]
MAKAFDTDRCSGMRGTQGNNNDQPSHNGKEVMIDGVPVNDPSYGHDTVCVEQKKRRFQDESMDAGSLEELINQQRTRQLERNLMTDDFSAPLTENVPLEQIRPQPPQVQSTFFNMYQVVDAFDNDGWWVGQITRKMKNRYYVYFENYGEEILYQKDNIRMHHD